MKIVASGGELRVLPTPAPEMAPVVKPVRFCDPGITPLAAAGFDLDGQSFESWLRTKNANDGINRLLSAWRSGMLPLDGSLADAAVPEAIYLIGGRSIEPPFAGLSTVDGLPVVRAEDPLFGALLAGQRWLAGRHGGGWTIDLGQTAMKVAAGERQWRFVRNFGILPLRKSIRTKTALRSQRFALREFAAMKLGACRRISGQSPDALLAGLCAQVDADCIPHGSSYAGLDGNRTFVVDVIKHARLKPRSVIVANDAELAALAAINDRRLSPFGRVLVLTLGFSVGAAVLDR